MKYQVVVSNIGQVYEGNEQSVAQKVFDDYVGISKAGNGRGGAEDVTLFLRGEILQEFFGSDTNAELIAEYAQYREGV